MAFEQITEAQYNKALEVIDDRVVILEKAHIALVSLKKMRRDFILLYSQGDHAGIDYTQWQEDFDAISSEVNTVKDEIIAAEEDSDGDGRGGDKIFKRNISAVTIKGAT